MSELESFEPNDVAEEPMLEFVHDTKRSRAQYISCVVSIFLIGAIFLIVSPSLNLDLMWQERFGQEKKFCSGTDEYCQTARDIRAKMNESVSPCEDFYEVKFAFCIVWNSIYIWPFNNVKVQQKIN